MVFSILPAEPQRICFVYRLPANRKKLFVERYLNVANKNPVFTTIYWTDNEWTMTDRQAGAEAAVAALPAKPHEFEVMLPDTNSRCAEW